MTILEAVTIVAVFAVVIAVSLYVLINSGMSMAERSRDTVYAGVHQAKSDVELSGPIVTKSTDKTKVRYIIFTVRNASERNPIDMTPCDGTASATNKTVISLSTATDHLNNVKWSMEAIGAADSDNLLETGEQFEVTIDLTDLGDGKALSVPLGANSQFSIQVKPIKGSALTIQRTLPVGLEAVMALH